MSGSICGCQSALFKIPVRLQTRFVAGQFHVHVGANGALGSSDIPHADLVDSAVKVAIPRRTLPDAEGARGVADTAGVIGSLCLQQAVDVDPHEVSCRADYGCEVEPLARLNQTIWRLNSKLTDADTTCGRR